MAPREPPLWPLLVFWLVLVLGVFGALWWFLGWLETWDWHE
jgi:hypothetical protein